MTFRSHLGRIGLRARLTLLLAIAMLPLAGVMAWDVRTHVRTELAQARTELARAAELAAATQAELFEGAHQLLAVARENPAVTAAGGEACDGLVGLLLAARPQFMTMGVVDATGSITCHTTLRERRAFSDPSLVERVLSPGAPRSLVGNFMVGKVTGQPTVAIAAGLDPGRGGPGMVFVSLDLDRLSSTAESASDHGRYEVTILQPSTGRMLAHFPPIPVPFGTSLGESPLVVATRDQALGGIAESVGVDGVERLYGFAPIPGAESGGLVLAIGLAKADILAEINAKTMTQAGMASLTFLAALAATWWLGALTQLRPIAAMARVVGAIERGDLGARTRLEDWQAPEYRALAGAMNAAAARLEDARRADEAIAASESRYRMLADNTGDMVTALDASGRRTFVSPASRDILGRDPASLLERHPAELAHPDDAAGVEAMLAELRAGRPVGGVRYRLRHADGHYVWIEVTGRPLEGGAGMVMGVRDISARHAMEQKLEEANRRLAELAATDGLTGVVNRRGFDAVFKTELERSEREGGELGVLMIDVDFFKSYNDLYGHVRGDECLRAVASAIAATLRRPVDTLARYGGEEFVLLMPGAGAEEAAERARAVNASVERLCLPHAGSSYGIVTVSVGATALRRAERRSAVDLVEEADEALYGAKAAGRNRVLVHDSRHGPTARRA